MRLKDAAAMALSNLHKNPVRSLLTVLGLGVGIGAVLTVLTLGASGEDQVEVQIARLGVDKVWITPEEGETLTAAAGETIAAAVQAPACAGAYTSALVRLEDHAVLAQVNGYDSGLNTVYAPSAVQGRLFNAREYDGSAVALVDTALAEALGDDVLGKRVDVGSRKVRIVGIVEGMKVQMLPASNGILILPLQTLMDTYAAPVSEVTVGIPQHSNADDVGDAAVAALGKGYKATSLQAEIDAARSVVRIFVMVLASVAVVCMLTGGIGVMNILLVSVRERRREIGLLKAIGGTSAQVGLLFLLEAVGYALTGGLLGLVLGMAMISGFGRWIGLEAALHAELALPTVLAASLLGAVFGVAPAVRAACLQPVDALKND